MATTTKHKSLRSFGPLSITEGGEYDNITCFGPMTIKASVKADNVKVHGPMTISAPEVTIDSLKVNGPCTATGTFSIAEIKINGPVSLRGTLRVADWGKINGPLTVDEDVILEDTTSLIVNGPTRIRNMIGGDEIELNGPASVNEIHGVNVLVVDGGISGNLIQAREVHVNIRGNTRRPKVGKIEAEIVTIDKSSSFNIETVGGRLLRRVTRAVQWRDEREDKECIQEVEEIVAEKVFLAHARVKKVMARELELGENAEVEEFVELTD